jgi:hypothetical protein
LLEGSLLVDGKVQRSFRSGSQKGARLQECHQEYYEYQVVTVDSCGQNCTEVTVTLYRGYQTVCSEGGDFGGGGSGAEYEPGVGGNGGGSSGGGTGGGSTGGVPLVIPGPNFNLQNAVNTPGPDREVMNTQLKDALFATGLATNITGWSFDKAEALARSIGAELTLVRQLADGVGFAGLAIDSYQLYMSVSDGKDWDTEDTLNAIQVGLV